MTSRMYYGAAVLLVALSACAASLSPDQAVKAVAPSACQGWNDAERILGPKIPAMSDGEHKTFLFAFDVLTGGSPLAKTGKGLCRQPWETVSAATFANDTVQAVMRQITPLLTKYK